MGLRAAKIVRAVATVYMTAALVAIAVGYAGIIWFRGWAAFLDVISPFNFFNFIAAVVTLAPGIGLLLLADKLERER